MHVVTAAERPELIERADELTSDALPEYNNHGAVLHEYWPRLTAERPEFQFCLVEESDQPLVLGHSVPVAWDGSIGDLPAGIDGAITRAFDEAQPTALCAMLIAVRADAQGRGLSGVALGAMRALAVQAGFPTLIAPVRPSLKELYPLVPIERYATWRRPDGLLFDPWMRVHERAGARILRPEPHSLGINGTVGEWEAWTSTEFPESGTYWFPRGLATVQIDRETDTGSYWEPNVWMQHEARPL
jgi:hypothetical protein